jgi:hypothetical protein
MHGPVKAGCAKGWEVSWITWAFGGVGVAVPIALIGWFYFDRRNSSQDRQAQRSGNNSINYQAGGNMRVDGNSEIKRQDP